MENKIKKITLWERKTETDRGGLEAVITDEGDLKLENHDGGKIVGEFFGGSDLESWVLVDKDYKDTIMLWLIKERFDSDDAFKKWLDEKKIPNKSDLWITGF